MNYKIQVGKVMYNIEAPALFQWKETDSQFFVEYPTTEREVCVTIEAVDKLPKVNETLTYAMDGMKVWKTSDGEIREYEARFVAGYPVYMQSHYRGDRIQVYYNEKTGLWNNPNVTLWNFLHLEELLLEQNGITLHCCYTEYKGEAILFSAPSGTGKTTQAELWKKCYNAEIVNGDKCLLQKDGQNWEAWGYPLHGSADECVNKDIPIRAIVIVRQAKEDSVEELSKGQKVRLLYSESTINGWKEKSVEKALDLLSDIVDNIPVVLLKCTMNDHAAHVLHRYLYGEE